MTAPTEAQFRRRRAFLVFAVVFVLFAAYALVTGDLGSLLVPLGVLALMVALDALAGIWKRSRS